MDDDLRTLERAIKEATTEQDKNSARTKYRRALIRAGKPELAGIEAGDLVIVDEKVWKTADGLITGPWILGEWTGLVIRVFEAQDKYIRPIEQNVPYRVRPSPEYLARGLYLTREDRTTLIQPHE